MKKTTLEEVLKTASDRIFPAEIGEAKVNINSRSRDGDTPLHVFIWGGETEKALFLIENGADVNAVGDMGETPLHAALHKGNRPTITALLDAGARTDIVSEFGKSPWDLAILKGIDLHGKK